VKKIQEDVARRDWTAIRGSFVAVKCALKLFMGMVRLPRKPCVAPGKEGLE
jgi:hypothetical protein